MAILDFPSTDKTVRIWTKSEANTFVQTQILKGHTESVTEVDVRSFEDDRVVLASAAGDETIHVWTATASAFQGSGSAASFTQHKTNETDRQRAVRAPQITGSSGHYNVT